MFGTTRLLTRLSLAVLALFANALPSVADTQMVFPRVVLQLGRFSGIAIANPTAGTADISIQAFNPDGSTFQPPATRSVKAGGQLSELAYTLLGAPLSTVQSSTPTRLWVEITSATDGLTGFYLEGDDALAQMDGSALSGSGTSLLVPLIENSGSSTTEISLVNPDDSEAATVTLTFVRDDGTAAATGVTMSLAKRGALQGPLSSSFALDYSKVSALRVESDRPVVCYASISRQSDNSLITVAAQSTLLPSRTLYFPQLAHGDSWITSVGIANSTTTDTVVTLTAMQGDGTLFSSPDVKSNPRSYVVPAGGSLRDSVSGIFGFPSTALRTGWIKAEASSSAIHGYVEYGGGTNRALVPAQSDGATRSIFSHQALQSPYFTGLAVLNAGGVAANVEVVSINADSTVAGKTQRILKPGQRESLLVQQWVPMNALVNGGAVFVKSDAPVISTQLFGTDSLAALANVPPQQAGSTFDPGANLPTISVKPPLAVVETGRTMKFTSTASGSVGSIAWSVDGATGSGSVSSSGLYTAPSLAPSDNSLVVQASANSGSLSGGATVDVVQRETLTSGLSQVTAVAYLENTQQFFVAEQQVLSGEPGGLPRQAVGTARIYRQNSGAAMESFTDIASDTVSKMLPFTDKNSATYLLLAGLESGNLYRLRLSDKQLATVATGLHRPNALVIDSLSGNLFVSEEDRVSVIPSSQFDPTAGSPGVHPDRTALVDSPTWKQIDFPRARGIASSGCDGSVYVASADGTLREFRGNRQRTLLSDLVDPQQLLVVYRQAQTCSDAVTLVILEATQARFYFPATGAVLIPFTDFQGARDVVFFPRNRPFGPITESTLVFLERRNGTGDARVLRLRVGPRYENVAPATLVVSGEPAPRDPRGDTFETALSERLAVHDLVAAGARMINGVTVLTLTFDRPVSPARLGRPNALAGFIEFDYQPGGVPPRTSEFNVFNPRSEGVVDSYIDLARERLYPNAASTAWVPIGIRFLGETVAIRLPGGSPDPSKFRFSVIAANLAEVTDVFPNIGNARGGP